MFKMDELNDLFIICAWCISFNHLILVFCLGIVVILADACLCYLAHCFFH